MMYISLLVRGQSQKKKTIANHDFMSESFEKVDHAFARNCCLMPLLHNGPKGPAISVIGCGMKNLKCPNFSFKNAIAQICGLDSFSYFNFLTVLRPER